jgi:hypothetical protein
MAPPKIVTAGNIGLRQPEPPEGRKGFQIEPMVFASAADQFQFSTLSLGNIPCSGIQSAWIDAQNLPTTNFLFVNINNGAQIFKIQGGTQGYIVITGQMPMSLLFTVDGGAATITVIIYNYNALFTGGTTQAPPVASGSGGGSGGVGSSGGGGGGAGGVRTGGGRPVL